LGGLDAQKPKTIIKNKNKDLMDSLLNTSASPTKSPRKEEREGERRKQEKKRRDSNESRAREKDERLKEKEERRNREKEERFAKEKEEAKARENEERNKQKEERRSSLSGKEEKVSSREKEKSKERSSKTEVGTLRVRPNLTISTDKERRTKEKESSPVTTPEAKKSPKVIKESNMFMDVLGDIMREPLKKKKRRLSEVRQEREAKEEAKKLKVDQEQAKEDEDAKDDMKQSTSSGSDEEKSEETSAMDEDDLPFAEPVRELPREVRGILVLARGKKPKRSIVWRPENSLVEVKYFEMEEGERENVWKTKSFEEMRKQELAREKQAGTGVKGSQIDDEEPREEKEEKDWKMRQIAFQDPEIEKTVEKIWTCYGKDSKEKEVQKEREGRVLKSLFFNSLPTDPTEPDIGDRAGDPRAVIKDIPGDDQSGEGGDSGQDSVVDHSADGWPTPITESTNGGSSRPPLRDSTPYQQAPAATNGLPANISAMLQDPNLDLLQRIIMPNGPQVNTPPPSLKPEDAELYQSQIAAANALAQNGDLPPVHLPPPPINQGYDGQQRGGYQHHNNHTDRPPPGYDHHRGHHNNFKNRSQSHNDGRWGREDNRGGFKANNFRRDERRDDRRGGGFHKRPCKFWMEKGRCKAEDSCLYPHPGGGR